MQNDFTRRASTYLLFTKQDYEGNPGKQNNGNGKSHDNGTSFGQQ